MQRLKVEISTKLLKDNADLKAQIVRSPDRQRKEISEMSSQRVELQNTVQAYRNKTRDLTGRIDTMGELEFVSRSGCLGGNVLMSIWGRRCNRSSGSRII
jgi:hypothetical protein